MNKVIGVFASLYLVITVVNGKTSDLIEFIKENKQFGKYIVAWIILYFIYQLRDSENEFLANVGELINILFPLVFVGYLLLMVGKIERELNKLFKILS